MQLALAKYKFVILSPHGILTHIISLAADMKLKLICLPKAKGEKHTVRQKGGADEAIINTVHLYSKYTFNRRVRN